MGFLVRYSDFYNSTEGTRAIADGLSVLVTHNFGGENVTCVVHVVL